MKRERKGTIVRWVLSLAMFLFIFAGAQVAFADETISFEEDEYTLVIGQDKYINIYSGEADESTWVSSNEDVVTIDDKSSYWVSIRTVGIGSSVISVSDLDGKTASFKVTVSAPEWELSETTFEDNLSNYDGEVLIDSDYWDLDLSATSSNTKVVSVNVDDYAVYLHYEGVGSAVVTVSDQYGKSATLNVTIKPAALAFEEGTETEYTEYDYNDTFNLYPAYYESNFVSVSSSNTGVIKVRIEKEEDGSWIEVTPVGAGTATITAKDQYGQTATIDITITQKYIDEMKYLPLFEGSFVELFYGDTEAFFTADSADFKGAEITAVIGGTNYRATYNGYSYGTYEYAIKNIPVLPVGTEISYTMKKGEAEYTGTSEIMNGEIDCFGFLELNSYNYIYTGKRITPATYVEYYYNSGEDFKYLKRGADYSVTYVNNLDVGRATVKVSGIGNYKNTLYESFTISPKGTSITKLSKAKKAFTVKWAKQAAKMSKTPITGYQIRYSLKSSMSNAKIVTVKGYASTSKKIKKLKRKKNYYVQVRTYKTVNNKNYYSPWSAKKKVKTK